MAYYEGNLPAGESLPADGLLSLVPYKIDLDFGGNAIKMEGTVGEVFTSERMSKSVRKLFTIL